MDEQQQHHGRAASDPAASDAGTPLISIGLPVYNGERYLDTAIESVLAQTFTDIELVICDNASTDRTQTICQAWAARDGRVRYFRNDHNIGGGPNHNLTFAKSSGAYFRWMGSDDYLAPSFLECTVAAMEADPGIVVCQSGITAIDADSREIRALDQVDRSRQSAAQRFADIIELGHRCEEVYGLMRSATLAQTGLLHFYTDADRSLIAHMALLGRFHLVPAPLFFQRIHADMSTAQYVDWRQRMEWWRPGSSGRIAMPYWEQLFHYRKIIASSPVDLRTKLHCYGCLVRWPTRSRRWRSLTKDLLLALTTVSRRAVKRMRRG